MTEREDHLGLQLDLREASDWSEYVRWLQDGVPDLWLYGWLADLPNPDNFLRAGVSDVFRDWWDDPAYWKLAERARQVTARQERLRLSWEADRLLGEQEVILFPLSYPFDHQAIKPYVKNFQVTPYRYPKLKDVTVDRDPTAD